jgi:steroid delta-isomerase-like uncharacterized protein
MKTFFNTSSAMLASAIGLVLACGAATVHAGPGHHNPPGKACNPVKRAAILAVAQDYVDKVNLRDPSLFAEIFTDDLILDSTAGYFEGLDQYTFVMSMVFEGLPDIHYTIEEVFVDGDTFTMRYSYSGTHLGELFGFPPSGDTVTCSGLEFNRVANGKIYESVNYTDLNCLLTSLAGN